MQLGELGFDSSPAWFRGKAPIGAYHEIKHRIPDNNHFGWIKGFLIQVCKTSVITSSTVQ